MDGNQYIYVVVFSNGAIKVGRTKNPEKRISQHIDRVSCVGVSVVNSFFTRCVGCVKRAEKELIKRCSIACTKSYSAEWFDGVAFSSAVAWATEIATGLYVADVSGIGHIEHSNLIDSLGGTTAVARACEVSPQAVSKWKREGIPKDKLMFIELRFAKQIRQLKKAA